MYVSVCPIVRTGSVSLHPYSHSRNRLDHLVNYFLAPPPRP
jgi:hypothetical protein